MGDRRLFKDLGGSSKIIVSILVLLTLGIVFGGFFFGMVGLFELMGVTYESGWALLVFAVLVFVVGFFFEIAAKVLKALSLRLKPSVYVFLIWRGTLDTLFTWLTIFTVDELVSNVSLFLWSEWIFAILLVMIDYVFDDKKAQRKKLA